MGGCLGGESETRTTTTTDVRLRIQFDDEDGLPLSSWRTLRIAFGPFTQVARLVELVPAKKTGGEFTVVMADGSIKNGMQK